MTIHASAAVEELLQQQMATGKYTSENQVLEEALRLLNKQSQHDETLQAIREGIADADAGRVMSIDEAFESVRQSHPYLRDACDMESD